MTDLKDELKQLKERIVDLEKDRTFSILKLGEIKYAELRDVEFDESIIEEILSDIQELDKKIFDYKDRIGEIEYLKDEHKCGNCQALITLDDKFCKECGSEVNKVEDLGEVLGRCSVCDYELYEDDNYCSRCGNRSYLGGD